MCIHIRSLPVWPSLRALSVGLTFDVFSPADAVDVWVHDHPEIRNLGYRRCTPRRGFRNLGYRRCTPRRGLVHRSLVSPFVFCPTACLLIQSIQFKSFSILACEKTAAPRDIVRYKEGLESRPKHSTLFKEQQKCPHKNRG